MEEAELSELKKKEQNNEAKIKIAFPLPFCLYLKDGEYSINQNGEEIILSLEKKIPETFDSRLGIELLKPGKIEDDKEYLTVGVSKFEESPKTYTFPKPELEKLKTRKGKTYLIEKPELIKRIKGSELKDIKEGYLIIGIMSEEGDLRPPQCVLYMNCERKNDKKGFFRYTEVTVLMAYERTNVMDSKFWSEIMDKSLNAINRLIEVYRYITGDYYAERLTNEYSEVVRKHGEMEILKFELHPKLIPFIGDKKEGVHRRLKDFLAEDKPVPIFENILLNAEDLLLKEDYRLAVLEAVIALEVYLHDFLENKFKNNKKYDEPLINHLLKRPDINLRLKELLELATGKKLHEWNKSLWDEWDSGKDGVKKLRNDITHRKKITVTPEEAKNAINTIEEIIRCIKKLE